MEKHHSDNGESSIDSVRLRRAQKQGERGTTMLPIALGLARSNLNFMQRLITASNRVPGDKRKNSRE